MTELATALLLIIMVAASYYLAAGSLAPSSRNRGDAIAPYMCGERAGPLKRSSLPYPWLLLLFASVESVPVAVLVSGGGAATLLFASAGAFLAIAARDIANGKRRPRQQ